MIGVNHFLPALDYYVWLISQSGLPILSWLCWGLSLEYPKKWDSGTLDHNFWAGNKPDTFLHGDFTLLLKQLDI